MIKTLCSKTSRLENIIQNSVHVFSLDDKENELQDKAGSSSSTNSESEWMEDYISYAAFAVGKFSRRKFFEEMYSSPQFYANPGGYI